MMTTIKTYRDILVWQKAMLLVNKIYKVTSNFPDTETFVLTSQLRRSAISIPSTIAESYGKRSPEDYLKLLNIALGSLFEFQTQIEIALNQEYLNKQIFDLIYEDSRDIERMLTNLIRKLN